MGKILVKKNSYIITRAFDIVFALGGLIILSPVFVILTLLGFFDTGSPFFLQKRVGRNRVPFTLIKFRTMKKDVESVATHLVSPNSVTLYGRFLRRIKLDELPQLINVLSGKMSLVGPRPCLLNQHELINERTKLDVFKVRPGITGLAQINNIDMSDPVKLAKIDHQMNSSYSVGLYIFCIVNTVLGRGQGDRVAEQDNYE